jgi:hypothetical protein
LCWCMRWSHNALADPCMRLCLPLSDLRTFSPYHLQHRFRTAEPTSCYLRKGDDLALPPTDEAATELLQQQWVEQGQQYGAEGRPERVLMSPECLDMRCQVGGSRQTDMLRQRGGAAHLGLLSRTGCWVQTSSASHLGRLALMGACPLAPHSWCPPLCRCSRLTDGTLLKPSYTFGTPPMSGPCPAGGRTDGLAG